MTEERVNFARWRHVDEWMDGSGEARWMDDPKLPSQILSTPIVSTPATDYIRTEAERLSNDTAARFIDALDAMDGATEPMESDSDMNVKSLDSDKDVTSGLHARSKRSEHSVSDIDVFRATRNTVTITISREAAAHLRDGDPWVVPDSVRDTCRAALEGER